MGNGQLSATNEGLVNFRWSRGYAIIFRANYLLKRLSEIELSENDKKIYVGEAHFLRGVAYSILAETYGGVPILLGSISTDEARNIARNSADETWGQVISDYDMAIENLGVDAPAMGRATKGAAMAMKMRAFLYQNKFNEVLAMAAQIEELGKYSLFPSYEGLFTLEHENNEEVIFDIQYMRGENSQGSRLDQFTGTGTGSCTRGSRYVPTDDLVNAYERRIEFALEGLYWMDIKRWHLLDGFLNDVYPMEIRDNEGGLIETRFPDGFKDHFILLPIPQRELSLNDNLTQNPGW